MTALLNATDVPFEPDRRSFLWGLASFGLTRKGERSGKKPETVYRFAVSGGEVRMSVEFFESAAVRNFHFRDSQANRGFCLSSTGEEGSACVEDFDGSVAIARYSFRGLSQARLQLRERVVTIDYDSRMGPRAPFERALQVENQVASDIQAFGYDRKDPAQAATARQRVPLWCLLRQDLYLNGQSGAFLIVHWKHTAELISLVDVIPGEETEWIREGS